MRVVCSAVSATLPSVDIVGASGLLEGHVQTCARCRREVRAYREIYRVLAAMRDEFEEAPSRLRPRVMASLGPVAVPDLEESGDHRVQVAAAAALATAAAGTAVLVRMYRHRAA